MADDYKFPDEDLDASSVDGEEFELEIVDDTPEQDRGRKPLNRPVDEPSDDELDSYSDGVKKRIKELTHARHDERRAKESTLREKAELVRFTQQLIHENRQLKDVVNTGSQQFAETARTAAETSLEMAKKKYKEAYELGDTDAMLEAQQSLTNAQLSAQSARNFNPISLQVDDYPVDMQYEEPKAPEVDEKTMRWQAQNQWFGTPGYEDMTSYALGLHQKLVNSGVDPRSDEYFGQINVRLKSTFRDFFGDSGGRSPSGDGSKRPATVVAPGTRSTGAKKIRLNTSQITLAKRLGLTPQQYAEAVAKMERSNG
jgi:hypothetical protein